MNQVIRPYTWDNPPKAIEEVPIIVARLDHAINLMLVSLRTANERGKPDDALFEEYQVLRQEMRFLRAWQAHMQNLRLEEKVSELGAEWDSFQETRIAPELKVFRQLCDYCLKKLQCTESELELQRLSESISRMQKKQIHRIKSLLEKRAWLMGSVFEFARRKINSASETAQQEVKKIRAMVNVKRHAIIAKM